MSHTREDRLVDLIIISSKLHDLTEQCINSINDPRCRIIVLEESDHKFHVETFKSPPRFGYNKYANYGARLGNLPYIMICNNDLIFKDGWLDPLLAANHPLVSPKCPNDERQTEITENTLGWKTGKHFSGWCFMITRELFNKIGGFDEDFVFWCSDNSLLEQVKPIQPMLVPDSTVIHLRSQTLNTLSQPSINNYTKGEIKKFNRKYNQDLYGLGK